MSIEPIEEIKKISKKRRIEQVYLPFEPSIPLKTKVLLVMDRAFIGSTIDATQRNIQEKREWSEQDRAIKRRSIAQMQWDKTIFYKHREFLTLD